MQPSSKSCFAWRSASFAALAPAHAATGTRSWDGGGDGVITLLWRGMGALIFAMDASAIVGPGDPPNTRTLGVVNGVSSSKCLGLTSLRRCATCGELSCAAFSILAPNPGADFFGVGFPDVALVRPLALGAAAVGGTMCVVALVDVAHITLMATKLGADASLSLPFVLVVGVGGLGAGKDFRVRCFFNGRYASGSFAKSFTEIVALRSPDLNVADGTSGVRSFELRLAH